MKAHQKYQRIRFFIFCLFFSLSTIKAQDTLKYRGSCWVVEISESKGDLVKGYKYILIPSDSLQIKKIRAGMGIINVKIQTYLTFDYDYFFNRKNGKIIDSYDRFLGKVDRGEFIVNNKKENTYIDSIKGEIRGTLFNIDIDLIAVVEKSKSKLKITERVLDFSFMPKQVGIIVDIR